MAQVFNDLYLSVYLSKKDSLIKFKWKETT